MKENLYRAAVIGMLTLIAGMGLVSCSCETMGTYAHSFEPFGKGSEKTKELKSTVTLPDTSLSLK